MFQLPTKNNQNSFFDQISKITYLVIVFSEVKGGYRAFKNLIKVLPEDRSLNQ
jgi:hypothetical protein